VKFFHEPVAGCVLTPKLSCGRHLDWKDAADSR
jgi:hypothetical protein